MGRIKRFFKKPSNIVWMFFTLFSIFAIVVIFIENDITKKEKIVAVAFLSAIIILGLSIQIFNFLGLVNRGRITKRLVWALFSLFFALVTGFYYSEIGSAKKEYLALKADGISKSSQIEVAKSAYVNSIYVSVFLTIVTIVIIVALPILSYLRRDQNKENAIK